MNTNTLRKICITISLTFLVVIVSVMPAHGKESSELSGPVFAVFAPFMGPLAVLALIFPSVFGGVLVLFKQWRAFFTVVTCYTVIMLLHWWFAADLVRSWWGTQTALWLSMTFVTLVGALWAWRRNLNMYEPGRVVMLAPVKTELIVLSSLSLLCLVGVVVYLLWPPAVLDNTWAILFILTGGLWAGLLYKSYRVYMQNRINWYEEVLNKYAVFDGRARRKEYWFFFLFNAIIGLVLAVIDARTGLNFNGVGVLGGVYSLAVLIPGLAVTVRRLHDTGKSGWLILIALIPIIGVIILLVWMFADSEPGMNQYGPNPKGDEGFGGEGYQSRMSQPVTSSLSAPGLTAKDSDSPMPTGTAADTHFREQQSPAKSVGIKEPEFAKSASASLPPPETNPSWSARPARIDLPTEGIILFASLAGFILFLLWNAAPLRTTEGELIAQAGGELVAKQVDQWETPLAPVGMTVSSPCVVGDHLYVGWALQDPFNPTQGRGAIHCLNRHTKEPVWDMPFDADGQMRPVFSTPTVVNGLLYVGEGFHYDPDCKLFCLDAKTGQKRWEFPTKSQIESGPTVAGGKVYFGAGNDGVYCVDALTGKQYWRYGQEPGAGPIFRVGASAVVADDRVYVGSGVDREHPDDCDMAVVCLQAQPQADKAKQQIWRVTTNLPCWAAPVVSGDQVFFALGNGDLQQDAAKPAGKLLCLDPSSGKELWPAFQVDNGILSRPAVDAQRVYFGCRDGYLYCVGRFDGKLRWKRSMDSPILSSPVLDQGELTGRAHTVFAVSSKGRVACFDAETGEVHWTFPYLEDRFAFLTATPALVVTPSANGTRRQLYFGATLNGLTLPMVFAVEDIVANR
jgi:outer membrane protein assembly factor BamB/uncharacterized membrane protein YhaH (DUF805 family)